MIDIDIDTIDPEILADYEAMFIDAYRELYPEYEWSFGSMLYEMVIRPAAVRAATDEEDLETLRENMSLYLASVAESPDADMVASLASNFRVPTKGGIYGTGDVAIYSKLQSNIYVQKGSILIAGGVSLTVDKTYVGVADDSEYVDTADTVYRSFVAVGSDYAFTIPVRTQEYIDESVARGVQVSMDSRPTQVTRIETASSISGGRAEASTSEILQQALYGVTA